MIEQLNDGVLIVRSKEGDLDAFKELHDKYKLQLLTMLRVGWEIFKRPLICSPIVTGKS